MKQTFIILTVVFMLIFGVTIGIQAQDKTPDVVVLKGNPMGGVKFNHTAHVKLTEDKCETCHHASKPEKQLTSAHQKCQDCHTKTATPPMKTQTELAFHTSTGKKGICIDCHSKEVAAGKASPLKCAECHKKENV